LTAIGSRCATGSKKAWDDSKERRSSAGVATPTSFLTNKERDINKEIKQIDLSSGDEAKLQGKLIFDDVLKPAGVVRKQRIIKPTEIMKEADRDHESGVSRNSR
jgi:hypothetical protein